MKITHLTRAEHYEPHPDWKRSNLCEEPNLSIEHFVKPALHESPLHHHPQEQVTLVIQGKMMVVSGDGSEAVLEPGDTAYFAGNEPHRVINLLNEPSSGVDIFTPRRSFDFWRNRQK